MKTIELHWEILCVHPYGFFRTLLSVTRKTQLRSPLLLQWTPDVEESERMEEIRFESGEVEY